MPHPPRPVRPLPPASSAPAPAGGRRRPGTRAVRALLPVPLAALCALGATPPAAAGDWSYEEMATVRAAALSEDPLYVGPLHAGDLAEQDAEALRARLARADVPVYVVLIGRDAGLDDYVADLALHSDAGGHFFVVGRDGETLHGLYSGTDGAPGPEEDPARLTAETVNSDRDLVGAPLDERLGRAVDLVERGGPAGAPGGAPVLTAAASVLVGVLLCAGAWRLVLHWSHRPVRVAPLTEEVVRTVDRAQQDEYRERLAERLTGCGQRVASHTAGPGRVGEALEAYGAAAKVLDTADDMSDLVGAHVLLDICDAALDGGPPPPHCFFDPRHHGGTAHVRWRAPASFDSVRVLACRACRKEVRAHRTPAAVPDSSGARPLPYYAVPPEESVWAATGYGTLGSDLPGRVMRGGHRGKRRGA
ncbi:hypothetical protein [Nocardiopsis sp. CA-288880]|uniref:hypothetical protein n=1 Tax=Nocardiopsis sp. CA-288880 TaxID=3239995 RepID=UPI003D9A09E3